MRRCWCSERLHKAFPRRTTLPIDPDPDPDSDTDTDTDPDSHCVPGPCRAENALF
ncbi:MAG: hypothetical protein PHF14_04985 [Verrucomicrobiota bacterium]|nr:hypothetical protein [Verrucomicrobiota bacterium]